MTECSETLFPFEAHFSRHVVAQFEGSWLTTEGGSLLLRGGRRDSTFRSMRAEFVGMRWFATSKVLTVRDLGIHGINTAQCLISSHSAARVAT
jgi:hypothetical protein